MLVAKTQTPREGKGLAVGCTVFHAHSQSRAHCDSHFRPQSWSAPGHWPRALIPWQTGCLGNCPQVSSLLCESSRRRKGQEPLHPTAAGYAHVCRMHLREEESYNHTAFHAVLTAELRGAGERMSGLDVRTSYHLGHSD
uniref:cDNA FLJ23862 fis, clone LNG08564 n=1 Tax=Homo sapiens TaxID=9606 RepID=Q8TCI0_HUMAN|nr:unnamed protein product [Homo sapiens]